MIESNDNINYPGIGSSMQGIGQQFSSTIPHIKLGKEGFVVDNSKKNDKNPQNRPNPQQNTIPTPPSDDLIEKLRKWGVIILCAAVVGFAIYQFLT